MSYEDPPKGRKYIGYHAMSNTKHPLEDGYFGKFKDKTFKPTKKIILSYHLSREEAKREEYRLQVKYNVEKNPEFANRKVHSPAFIGMPKGFKHSPATKARMRQAKLNTRVKKLYDFYNKTTGQTELQIAPSTLAGLYGLNKSQMCAVARGDVKSCGGWVIMPSP